MSNLPISKNPLVINKAFRTQLETRTGLNNFDSDSKIAAITTVLANELINLRQDTIKAFQALQHSTAKGPDLDALGRDIKLPRLVSTRANVNKYEKNIAFYVSSGIFGDINGDADITIPKGTVIYSIASANDAGQKVEYVTTEEIILDAGDNIAYVSAEAKLVGAIGNVGSGVLRSHNFTNYDAVTLNALKVVNFYSILNGSENEQDAAYRFRLIKKFEAVQANNKAALELASLGVPGIRNTIVVPNYYGVGTVGVFALGAEKQVSPRLLNALQLKLNQIQTPGTRYYALAPINVLFDLEIKISNTGVLSTDQKDSLQIEVQNALNSYFRKIILGSYVSIDDIQAQVLKIIASKKVTLSNSNVLDKVFYSRNYMLQDPNIRDTLLQRGYQLSANEVATLNSVVVSYTV